MSLSKLKHVAIIMDGNGRWAKNRGLPRSEGHAEGAMALKRLVEGCAHKLNYLTVYAFSTENWRRTSAEVENIFTVLERQLDTMEISFLEKNIRLKVIGQLGRLPKSLKERIEHLEKRTAKKTGLTLQIALDYSGRSEILRAAKALASDAQNGTLDLQNIEEEDFSRYLDTHNIPDPDLLIRTSGEQRLSNYLLWQLAYTELLFIDKYWPDFTVKDFESAVLSYENRDRRFGHAA